MAYDNDIPQAGDLISSSQLEILNNFLAIDSGTTGTGIGFSRNHITMTDATNGGLHNRVDYYAAVASPAIAGFIASLYPKTVTNVELFYKNGTADIQLTNSAVATSAASGQGIIPGGLIVQAGSGTTGGGGSLGVTFTTAFPTALISVVGTVNDTSGTRTFTAGGGSAAGFTAYTSSTNKAFYWIAIGY